MCNRKITQILDLLTRPHTARSLISGMRRAYAERRAARVLMRRVSPERLRRMIDAE